MHISEALIQKFLGNKCTEAEAVVVVTYFEKEPAALEAYLRSSWEEAGHEKKEDDPEYDEMLGLIKKAIFGHRATGRRYIKWISIAASLLLLAGSYYFFQGAQKTGTAISAVNNKVQQTVTPSVKWVAKYNSGAEQMKIALPDSSVVTLSPQAGIRYKEVFNEGDKRDVYLEGEAFFEVTKDKTRPFTVHAGFFATTALGTSFLVTESKTSCSVKLYTGKVVITALRQNIAGWNENVYLLPGQQMQYDMLKQSLALTAFSEKRKTTDGKEKNSALLPDDNTVLAFNNTALPQVLDQLIDRYDRPIEYDKAVLSGMYFTGSVLKKDSLPMILNVIARMNGLIVTVKADGFLIK